jgi:hypothetical protein
MKIASAAIIMVLIITACACVPLFIPHSPLPTITPLPPTSTSTPTTVWFPLTATYTPLPTATYSITPTLGTHPSYGNLLFTDDFSNQAQWNLGVNQAGSIALGKKEISLAINQPRGYLSTLRKNTILSDFYLEITASPSICRAGDEYGLLLRVSPSLDFFRFGLTCNGEARLDRMLNGQASSPQPLVMNGAIPPGAPSSSRLVVWAMGSRMLFYVNDEYLFSIHDSVLLVGGFGVFARASCEDVVTVNFSELAVYKVSN